MDPTARPRIKVCCIASVAEARLAVQAGASALGLVSQMPSGPGVLDDESIAAITATVPPGVFSVLLTCERSVSAIVAQQRKLGSNALQLCDAVDDEVRRRVREALPGIAIIQVVHVAGPESFEEAVRASRHSHAILLDSGNPAASVKELGGTGRVHDWTISRRIREALGVPVFLAGGLRAENAGEAMAAVGPFGLDVCTGVRTDGHLDPGKLRGFCQAVLPNLGD